MKATDLMELIGEAKEEYVADAKRKRGFPRWAKRTFAVAACLCLVVGSLFAMLFMNVAHGRGGDSNLIYMYYTGPVLPLSMQQKISGICAERTVNFSFAPYKKAAKEAIITDGYVLKNDSPAEQTVTLLYPYAGNIRDLPYYPQITVNGSAVTASMHPGPYCGGFTGAWGAPNAEEGSVNAVPIRSFSGYEALLKGDRYVNSAFDEFPNMDIPITVYRLHDFRYTSDKDAESPTLSMDFFIDPGKTTVLSYGMNGSSFHRKTGHVTRSMGGICYNPNLQEQYQHPEDGYVVLLGEDLQAYTVTGYRNGGCQKGQELTDLGCTVTRYETTLGAFIRARMEQYSQRFSPLRPGDNNRIEDYPYAPTVELCCNLAAELLYSNGPLSDTPVERYSACMLEDIFSAVYSDGRILYFSFDVTIPAGGSTAVDVTLRKEASVDYVGRDKGKDGYDMATTLGSSLTFTKQKASLSDFSGIHIVNQNFGFDLKQGITQVTLDLREPHYWMEVRTIPTPET